MSVPIRVRAWAWRVVGIAPAWAVATFLADDRVPPPMRAEAAIVLVATLIRPSAGLLLVAAVAPLGDIVYPLLGGTPVHHAETLVVSWLAAWLLVRGADGPGLPSVLIGGLGVLVAAVVASAGATALQLHRESWFALYQTRVALARDYLFTNDFIGVHAAAAILEGLGLLAGASAIARRAEGARLHIALTLAAAGVAAATSGVLLSFGIAPAATVARQLAVGLPRYSAVSVDVNATASLYLLLLGVTVGVAWPIRAVRLAWVPAAVAILYALRLTGSVAAIMTVVLACGIAAGWWIAHSGSRALKAAAVVAASILVAAVIGFMRTPRAESSLGMRGGFTRASLRMIEARPVLGVGVGRYYPLSRLVLPPSLGWSYGLENAHDYYLQVAAELGVVGLAAFAWVLASALGPPIWRVVRRREDAVTVGCLAGALMYLVTAAAGQPFLVPETVTPFWIALGLIVSRAPAERLARSVWVGRAATAMTSVLVLTMPLRANAAPSMGLSAREDGLGIELIDRDGGSFREASSFASLFAAPTLTEVEVPVRLAQRVRAEAAVVSVKVPGGYATEVRVGHQWMMLHVPLPGPEPLMWRQRINLALLPAPEIPPEPLAFDVGTMRPRDAR
jgi:O-antigen ligase